MKQKYTWFDSRMAKGRCTRENTPTYKGGGKTGRVQSHHEFKEREGETNKQTGRGREREKGERGDR